ncbi:oligosaccharide flippase family protein, partial [Bradyrhizobium sp. STM 3809]|uniref:oligosaccharide flippase family protein n=1 Tax=Bradyrhizobium sp. STM 3809 TaxID=551936 RepID=UPI001479275A
MSNSKIIVGTTVLALGNACRYLLQLVLVPVLARILGPSSYGSVALATPFFFFLMLFSDLGLGASLVRAPKLTRNLESSVFWIVMAIALVLASLLVVTAQPLAWLLQQPALAGILLGFAPLFLLSSATIVPSARLQRAGRFKAVALADLLSTVGAAAVAIVTA